MKRKDIVGCAMEQLDIDTLHKHQNKPIDSILAGQDTLGISPTGSEKSAMSQSSALAMHRERCAAELWSLNQPFPDGGSGSEPRQQGNAGKANIM